MAFFSDNYYASLGNTGYLALIDLCDFNFLRLVSAGVLLQYSEGEMAVSFVSEFKERTQQSEVVQL